MPKDKILEPRITGNKKKLNPRIMANELAVPFLGPLVGLNII